ALKEQPPRRRHGAPPAAPAQRNARTSPLFSDRFETSHSRRRFRLSLHRPAPRSCPYRAPVSRHSKAGRTPDRQSARPDGRRVPEEFSSSRRGGSLLRGG